MSCINTASSYSGKLQSPVTLLVTKSNSDNDENGWHKDNNSDCEYQVDDDKDLFVRLADGLTQEDKMQQGITACAQATIDGGMVQSKDKESCTNGSGAAWFFPYYLRSSQKLLMHLQDYNSVEAMAFNG